MLATGRDRPGLLASGQSRHQSQGAKQAQKPTRRSAAPDVAVTDESFPPCHSCPPRLTLPSITSTGNHSMGAKYTPTGATETQRPAALATVRPLAEISGEYPPGGASTQSRPLSGPRPSKASPSSGPSRSSADHQGLGGRMGRSDDEPLTLACSSCSSEATSISENCCSCCWSSPGSARTTARGWARES